MQENRLFLQYNIIMTELIYYQNPKQIVFRGHVIAKEQKKKGWAVQLDKTCFYPEGGGQPSDIGTLNEVPVEKVTKKNGEILHHTAADPGNGELTGKIDWTRRYDYMQQHTGQHIISAVLKRNGYDTVSVHQGDAYTTIEVSAPKLPQDLAALIEEEANREVRMNKPVKTYWVDESRIPELDLRREPKVGGKIRIVEINGLDRVACGGIHLETTGETGIIKEIGSETIRGNTRIYWKIGKRALADYRFKTEMVHQLKAFLSVTPEEITSRVEDLKGQTIHLEYLANQLTGRIADLYGENLLMQAENTDEPVFGVLKEESGQILQPMAIHITTKSGRPACLINITGNTFQWCITVPENITFDFNKIRTKLLEPIGGKGGGKPPVWQGIGTNKEGIEQFQNIFCETVLNARK